MLHKLSLHTLAHDLKLHITYCVSAFEMFISFFYHFLFVKFQQLFCVSPTFHKENFPSFLLADFSLPALEENPKCAKFKLGATNQVHTFSSIFSGEVTNTLPAYKWIWEQWGREQWGGFCSSINSRFTNHGNLVELNTREQWGASVIYPHCYNCLLKLWSEHSPLILYNEVRSTIYRTI